MGQCPNFEHTLTPNIGTMQISPQFVLSNYLSKLGNYFYKKNDMWGHFLVRDDSKTLTGGLIKKK